MRGRASSKSSLFLMEMMISIIFFSIAAAGCVQAFAKAHTLSTNAQEISMAQNLCAGAIEEMSIRDAEPSRQYFFDNSWEECTEEQAQYIVTVTAEEDQGMRHLTALAEECSGKEIYSLETDVYQPTGADLTGGSNE